MTGNPVVWFEIYVQDMARAKKFYEAVLDTKLTEMKSPGIEMWFFGAQSDQARQSYGANGALVHMEGFESGSNSVLVYFNCEDCGVEEGRVGKAGGRIQRGKTPIGEHGFISLVYDTEGNMFGLHSMK